MFIQQLDAAMEPHRVQFGGKKSMNRILMMKTSTLDERFMLLLELLTLSGTFGYGKIQDPESTDYQFDYNKLYKLLAEASMYVNNPGIVTMRFREAIQYLSGEFIRESVEWGDFTCISDIYNGKVKVIQFITKKNRNAVGISFAFKGKSGKVYDGNRLPDLMVFNQEELLDIVEWIAGDPDFMMDATQKQVIDYVLANKESLQKEFRNYRNTLIAYLNWIKAPEIRNSIIVYILEDLKIEHTYWPKDQKAVIAAKKAISKKVKA